MATKPDVPAVLDYYRVNRHFLERFEPARSDAFYTPEFWQEQVNNALVEFSYQQSLKLCMFPKDAPKQVIGKINFTQIMRGVSYSCVLGYSLSETNQGKGYMTESLSTAIQYIFATFNLHRIAANYMPRNQRSGNLLRRLGFTVEGYARDYLLIDGQWEDHILTSLLNPHWQKDIRY